MRNRCGDFPNSHTAALVSRSSLSRFRRSSNCGAGASSASGNCLARRAVRANRAIRSKSRSSTVARAQGGRVERSPADQILDLQIFDQRRIESGHQLGRRVDSLPDQPRLRLADQPLHSRMSGVVSSALYEDQAMGADGGRVVELPLGWRFAFLVFASVVAAEQPHADIDSFDFVQVEIVQGGDRMRDCLRTGIPRRTGASGRRREHSRATPFAPRRTRPGCC